MITALLILAILFLGPFALMALFLLLTSIIAWAALAKVESDLKEDR